jgi:hypothetical protein
MKGRMNMNWTVPRGDGDVRMNDRNPLRPHYRAFATTPLRKTSNLRRQTSNAMTLSDWNGRVPVSAATRAEPGLDKNSVRF